MEDCLCTFEHPYLPIHKVFGWIGAKTQEFRCKLGHFGANSSEYVMNRQVLDSTPRTPLVFGWYMSGTCIYSANDISPTIPR